MTVYSYMKKFEGGKVIEIDREVKEVSIPPTATRICEVACFFGSITSLDLESTNVIIIEKHAFANCHKLKEVKFPSCLEEICEGAFKQCTNLRHISFPPDSRLRKIGNSAFRWCSKMKIFEFPRYLEFIGDKNFTEFPNIKFDLRGTQVRYFGRISYFDCVVYFPPTVKQDDVIKVSEKCYNFRIEVDESHPVLQKDSCGYFFSNGTIFHGNKESRHVLIRRGVERIAGRCFHKSNLVSVTIPSSVTEINDDAFSWCGSLQHIRFTKDSQLRVIGKDALSCCSSIKKIHFPKSLKIIKERAFGFCKSLERVVFPLDSQLERIEFPFVETAIKRLTLPSSVRKIVDVCYRMLELESIFVSNEYYQSNEEGSAIFSRDGSELVCVIKIIEQFKIPDSVRVIKKRAFYYSRITDHLTIHPSVEVIEEEAFEYCNLLDIIEFEEGSKLKSLAFDAFYILKDLIINNENFVKMESGAVMSMNPRGIVFVPSELTEFEIPPGVEVIYSFAFYGSKIKNLIFPKSLKKICSHAFNKSSLESVSFEEGTVLDFIGHHAFHQSRVSYLRLPIIKGEIEEFSYSFDIKTIEFPPNLSLKNKELNIYADNIIVPCSLIPIIANFYFVQKNLKIVIKEKKNILYRLKLMEIHS